VEAGEMMKRMLRLKHFAYSTEQSYIIWLRDFYRHVQPTAPKQLDGANSQVASPRAPELVITP
jgi:hypothetical protein